MNVFTSLLAQSHSAGFLTGTGGIILIVALLLSIFWIWAMVDCLSSALPTGEKVMWFFLILFLHLVGAIVYYLLARKPRRGNLVT